MCSRRESIKQYRHVQLLEGNTELTSSEQLRAETDKKKRTSEMLCRVRVTGMMNGLFIITNSMHNLQCVAPI